LVLLSIAEFKIYFSSSFTLSGTEEFNFSLFPNAVRLTSDIAAVLCRTTVQLYVLMEYCRHGCLRDYLVNKRHDFQDTMDVTEKPAVWFKRPKLVSFQSPLDFDDADDHSVLTTRDLVCYAFQIARGMDFLASQKVGLCVFTCNN